MKQLFSLFTIFSMAMLLSSCEKTDTPNSTFTGFDKNDLNKELFADDTETASGFAFSSAEPWSISIGEEAKSTADDSWIEVDPMSGVAGTHTINIELDLNYTGEDRTAEITIKAGESTITITVKQKGTKEDGKTPVKVISAIIDQTDDETESYNFSYNDNREIEKLEYIATDKSGQYTIEKIYIYSDDKIVAKAIDSDPGSVTVYDETMILNSDGNAVSSEQPYSEGSFNWADKVTWTYDANHYVSQITTTLTSRYGNSEDNSFGINVGYGTFQCVWKDGNLTSVAGREREESRETTHSVNMSYTTYENKLNLDIYRLIADGGYSYYLINGMSSSAGVINRLGQISKNLIDTVTESADDNNNENTERTRFEYELDKDRYVTRVITYSSSSKYDGGMTEETRSSYKIEYKTL